MLYYTSHMTAIRTNGDASGEHEEAQPLRPTDPTANLRGPRRAPPVEEISGGIQALLRTNVIPGNAADEPIATIITPEPEPEPWSRELAREQARLMCAGLQMIPECAPLFAGDIPDRAAFEQRAGDALNACQTRYGMDAIVLNLLGRTLVGSERSPIRFCVRTDDGGFAVIHREIGSGGFGRVFAAVDRERPNRVYAVKTIVIPKEPSISQAVILSAERERQALQETGDLRGSAEDPDARHLVMRYERGPSLEKMMELNGGKLPIRLAVRIVRQAAEQLQKIVRLHLDLKPANLLVNVDLVEGQPDVRVHVIDWGASQMPGEDNVGISTPAYAPPEQMPLGGPARHLPDNKTGPAGNDVISVSKHSDVYALTVTLYKMLTGNTIAEDAPRNGPVLGGPDAEALRVMQLKHDTENGAERGVVNSERGGDRRNRRGRHPAASDTLLEEATRVPPMFGDGGQKVREIIAQGLERRQEKRISLEEYIRLLEQAERLLGMSEPYRTDILRLPPFPRLKHGGPQRANETDVSYQQRVALSLKEHFGFSRLEERSTF